MTARKFKFMYQVSIIFLLGSIDTDGNLIMRWLQPQGSIYRKEVREDFKKFCSMCIHTDLCYIRRYFIILMCFDHDFVISGKLFENKIYIIILKFYVSSLLMGA